MSGKKENNLLLISMSTLPKTPGEIFYQCKVDGSYFCGVSQQEVGTKYFLRSFQKMCKKFDKILIVESPETRDETKEISSVQPFLQDGYSFLKSADDSVNTSAVRFYKERICQYIQGREIVTDQSETTKFFRDEIEKYEKGIDGLCERNNEAHPNCERNECMKGNAGQTKYSQREIDELFCDIAINSVDVEEQDEQTAIFESIQQLCKEIQIFAKNSASVKLYLYMQGASRQVTAIIHAAINMLEMPTMDKMDVESSAATNYASHIKKSETGKIKLESSVAVNYDFLNNSRGKFNQIIDATFNDRIFEMVAGMNQFITTGRGDTLLNFYEDSSKLIKLKSEKEIIEAIRKISNALSLCCVNSFDDAMQEFCVALKNYEIAQAPNPLFQTFVKDLKEDYDKYHLLVKDEDAERINTTVNQVLWCLDKKLYQQALTLLESKVPNDIVNNCIIYFGNPNALLNFLNTSLRNRAFQFKSYETIDRNNIDPDLANYIFIHRFLKYTTVSSKATWCLSENLSCTESVVGDPDRSFAEQKPYWNRRIGELLKRYKKICDTRNQINHSNGEILLTDEIIRELNIREGDDALSTYVKVKVIDPFINYYYGLIKDGVSVDLSQQFSSDVLCVNENNGMNQNGYGTTNELSQRISFDGIDIASLPD